MNFISAGNDNSRNFLDGAWNIDKLIQQEADKAMIERNKKMCRFTECLLTDPINGHTMQINPRDISITTCRGDASEVTVSGPVVKNADVYAYATCKTYMTAYEKKRKCIPDITKVIFNDPATIVFWEDDTKTVVKCQDDDIFDPEFGLVMAITKKALGNKGNYYNIIKKWLPEETKEEEPVYLNAAELARRINDAAKRLASKGAKDE